MRFDAPAKAGVKLDSCRAPRFSCLPFMPAGPVGECGLGPWSRRLFDSLIWDSLYLFVRQESRGQRARRDRSPEIRGRERDRSPKAGLWTAGLSPGRRGMRFGLLSRPISCLDFSRVHNMSCRASPPTQAVARTLCSPRGSRPPLPRRSPPNRSIHRCSGAEAPPPTSVGGRSAASMMDAWMDTVYNRCHEADPANAASAYA